MLRRYSNVVILLTIAVLSAACVHRVASIDSPPPPIASEAKDIHILGGRRIIKESTGAAVLLTLDEHGNGHYEWKNGRLETERLINHTWSGIWFQEENDREGGF